MRSSSRRMIQNVGPVSLPRCRFFCFHCNALPPCRTGGQFLALPVAMADRWLIQYGENQNALEIVGKASTRAQAAAVARSHHDATRTDSATPLPIDPENPAGDYPCADGWYRITRLGSGKWRAVP